MSDMAVKFKLVLLDIEGTVCSISFVKDVLVKEAGGSLDPRPRDVTELPRADSTPLAPDSQFPYALEVLAETLRAQWDDDALAPYRAAFPPEHGSSAAALEAHVRDLMARDVKASSLKSLQGYLWRRGYETGRLRAPLYPDVAPRLRAWARDDGVRVVIYSSGSVAAQKLLFGHTDADADADAGGEPADLTPLLAGFFDTVNAGPKTEAASYANIAAHYPDRAPADWLFLSDNVKEVEAAQEAGMQSFVVQRPGNAELSGEAREKHRIIQSFDEI